MSKVKIPLKWYSDLIRIPGTKNEFILLEWFEEKECKNKTLWCLGKYMRVRQYKLNTHIPLPTLEKMSNEELTLSLIGYKLGLKVEKLGGYVQENRLYCPIIYHIAKQEQWFEGDLK